MMNRRLHKAIVLCVAIAGCSRNGDSTTPQLVGAAARGAAIKYQTIFTFDGSDGAYPESLLRYYRGKFYGTTKSGGAFGYGTVFSVTPSGEERVLHSFRGGKTDGSEPEAGVTVFDGALYGTTYSGGPYGWGVVYGVTLTGKERVLYRFGGNPDGENPTAGLTVLNGALYGTTSSGGMNNGGTVFSITKAGKEHVVYRFKYAARYPNDPDGNTPFAGLTNDQGLLYGTTAGGGSCGGGTIFTVTTTGRERVVHSFMCQRDDGDWPDANLTLKYGVFYGTTLQGGKPFYQEGVVFRFKPGQGESVIFGFPSDYDGARSEGSLVVDGGVIYGTTYEGGANNVGNIYSISKGNETVLHSFGVPPDGQGPKAGLIEVNGAFYGTTTAGGGFNNDGTVYKITP